ncbi:hypothetical protein Droror1_Dr00026982 [Drosera rotundifolia]
MEMLNELKGSMENTNQKDYGAGVGNKLWVSSCVQKRGCRSVVVVRGRCCSYVLCSGVAGYGWWRSFRLWFGVRFVFWGWFDFDFGVGFVELFWMVLRWSCSSWQGA